MDDSDRFAAEVMAEQEQEERKVHVYAAINAVSADLAMLGVSKGRRNQQQGYNFRGVDDMYNALATPLSRRGLAILPRVLSRECVERQSGKGGALFYVTVEVEFDFVSAKDGSKHVVKTFGEAMDSADKATNKAMSAAYKYAVMQVFCIPTEGDNDADATTHEVVPSSAETTLILDSLREAATDGPDALQERFRAIPNGPAKSAVWAKHGASLKDAAAKVAA